MYLILFLCNRWYTSILLLSMAYYYNLLYSLCKICQIKWHKLSVWLLSSYLQTYIPTVFATFILKQMLFYLVLFALSYCYSIHEISEIHMNYEYSLIWTKHFWKCYWFTHLGQLKKEIQTFPKERNYFFFTVKITNIVFTEFH